LGFGFVSMSSAGEPPTQAPLKRAKAAMAGDKPWAEAKQRTISGKVLRADGQPVEAELSLVWLAATPQPLGKTAADGSFRVTVPLQQSGAGGWLVARPAATGIDFQPTGMDHLPRSMTATAEVILRLPKERRIRGRILDQQGKPV